MALDHVFFLDPEEKREGKGNHFLWTPRTVPKLFFPTLLPPDWLFTSDFLPLLVLILDIFIHCGGFL